MRLAVARGIRLYLGHLGLGLDEIRNRISILTELQLNAKKPQKTIAHASSISLGDHRNYNLDVVMLALTRHVGKRQP